MTTHRRMINGGNMQMVSSHAWFLAMNQTHMDVPTYNACSTISGLAGTYSSPESSSAFGSSSMAELNGEVVTSPDESTAVLLNQLFEVSHLSTGWDSAASRPASSAALKNAAFAIIELQNRPSPEIELLDSGGILFEWNLPTITYQIEWFSEGGGEYSAFTRDAILFEGPMPESPRAVHWKLREMTLANCYLAEPTAALPA